MREEQQETNRRLENLERRMESIEYRITIIFITDLQQDTLDY